MYLLEKETEDHRSYKRGRGSDCSGPNKKMTRKVGEASFFQKKEMYGLVGGRWKS